MGKKKHDKKKAKKGADFTAAAETTDATLDAVYVGGPVPEDEVGSVVADAEEAQCVHRVFSHRADHRLASHPAGAPRGRGGRGRSTVVATIA